MATESPDILEGEGEKTQDWRRSAPRHSRAVGILAVRHTVPVVVEGVAAVELLQQALAGEFLAEAPLGKTPFHAGEPGADVAALAGIEDGVAAGRALAGDLSEVRRLLARRRFGKTLRPADGPRLVQAIHVAAALVSHRFFDPADAIDEAKGRQLFRVVLPGLAEAVPAGPGEAGELVRAILQAGIGVRTFPRQGLADAVAAGLALGQAETEALTAVGHAVLEDIAFAALGIADAVAARDGLAQIADAVLVGIGLGRIEGLGAVVLRLQDAVAIQVLGLGACNAGFWIRVSAAKRGCP